VPGLGALAVGALVLTVVLRWQAFPRTEGGSLVSDIDRTAWQSLFGEVIDTHSRADLVELGALVPVPGKVAREAGLGVPVALTRAAWKDCVAWTEADNARKHTVQDEDGRLWDVLWMTRAAVVRNRGESRATVVLHRVPRAGPGVRPRLVTLLAVIGPGDAGEPVITVMQPEEA
jgi:hypothetical protein